MGQRDDRDREFATYYASRGAAMRNVAYLLCGDWHLAEDLTQTAFMKLYAAWSRVTRHDALDAFVRKVLLRAFLDERRRPWWREHATEPGGVVFDVAAVAEPDVALRLALRAALDKVPPRQRAVLVLRFWLDLSVDQTADALDCSVGNIKSQTSRGLRALRAAFADQPTVVTARGETTQS